MPKIYDFLRFVLLSQQIVEYSNSNTNFPEQYEVCYSNGNTVKYILFNKFTIIYYYYCYINIININVIKNNIYINIFIKNTHIQVSTRTHTRTKSKLINQ